MSIPVRHAIVVFMLATNSLALHAEKADRDKPMMIEADRMAVDDRNKVQTFEGRVKIVKGTFELQAAKVVVTQDAEGYQKTVATSGEGGLSRFRQKREGRDEYVDGEAERIEYFNRTDKAQLFLRAHMKNGEDEVRGQYIEYDGYTESYLVTNGPNASVSKGEGRVRAVIQPKTPSAPKP